MWQLAYVSITLQMPKQFDGHSCGVFTIVTALHRAAGLSLNFDNDTINNIWRPLLAHLVMSDETFRGSKPTFPPPLAHLL
jgi:Ulp1 family protease